MAATKPICCGVATTCNGAGDDALYGGAGNDVIAYPKLWFRAIEQRHGHLEDRSEPDRDRPDWSASGTEHATQIVADDGYTLSDRARVGTRIGDGVVHVDLLAPEPGSNWQHP
jgi:hypothetical protein